MEKLELIILTHFYIFQKHRNSDFCGFFAHKDLEKKKKKKDSGKIAVQFQHINILYE